MELVSRPGVTWRPITVADLDRLANLYRVWETENAIPYAMTREQLEHELADPDVELDRDTQVAELDDGELAASLIVWAPPRTGDKHRAFLFSVVRAAHGELERDLIRWGVRSVSQRFGQHDDGLPRIVRAFAEESEHDRIQRYRDEGFEIVRYFVDMLRALDGSVPDIDIPSGVEISPWDDRWLEPSHAAHTAAFVDHWGSMPPTLDAWRHRFEAPSYRPDLSWVAVAGGDVVAYVLNAHYPQDIEKTGRIEGWIETLGTRPEWRKRGLASALISTSFRSFADAGFDHAAIGVDAASPTGAFRLYERLGFAEYHRSVALLKALDTAER